MTNTPGILESTFSIIPSWDWVIFFMYFFIVMAAVYMVLFAIATIPMILRYRERPAEDVYSILRSESLPPITFMVPAFNESKDIAYTVRTLLNLSYRYKQIIIVNDGSTDATLEILMQEFS